LPRALGERAKKSAAALDVPLRPPTPRNRALATALGVIDRRVDRMIAERRSSVAAPRDLLTQLLRAGGGEELMSDRQLRDEIVTLFVAGHETTATALAWAFYLLGRAPEAYARLEREALALGRTPEASDLERLPYAQQVFKEALRLYPPVPVFERMALEPTQIGGHPIERGQYVAVFPYALHRRPRIYPDPERFDPERFTPEAEERRSRHAFAPFGTGPRVCIGNHFALLEGPLVLATLLRQCRLEPVDDVPVEPDPIAATMRPLGAIRMRVIRR
jgi:cytochrome P450